MIVDLQENALPAEIQADVCIVGGGPAGITLALELAARKQKVILLESGGENYDARTQALYEGENVGREYYPLRHDRIRYLGGTSHHWGGWCVPLTPGDLEVRDWVPYSGWPISWAELAKYYDRAQVWCELDRLEFDPAAWLEPRFPLLPLNGSQLENYLYKWSPADQWRPPTHFGKVYRERLAKAENVQVVLHANVVDIACTENVASVQSVSARTLEGRELKVSASTFVLAAGGLETPRILLAANRQAPAGLGNDNDLVGRFFMEHLEGVLGHILIDDPRQSRWLASYEKRVLQNERVNISAAIRTSAATQASNKLLNTGFVLRSRVDENSGYVSAKRLASGLIDGRSVNLADDVGNVLTDLDEIALWIHHRRQGTHYEFPMTSDPTKIWTNTEQAPNPDSRVYLDDEVDELGIRRIALDWRLGDLERRTLLQSTRILGEEISRLTNMRVKIEDWLLTDDDELPDPEIVGGHHHMGTTRMADSPQTGVVDGNCRIHGIDNLYVAGSSVFPTGGYANPTLTIVALAVRLAEHLDARVASRA
jgi:choline dehydrogenase-like flavoprotein